MADEDKEYNLQGEHLIEKTGLANRKTNKIKALADDFQELSNILDDMIATTKASNQHYASVLEEETRKNEETEAFI